MTRTSSLSEAAGARWIGRSHRPRNTQQHGERAGGTENGEQTKRERQATGNRLHRDSPLIYPAVEASHDVKSFSTPAAGQIGAGRRSNDATVGLLFFWTRGTLRVGCGDRRADSCTTTRAAADPRSSAPTDEPASGRSTRPSPPAPRAESASIPDTQPHRLHSPRSPVAIGARLPHAGAMAAGNHEQAAVADVRVVQEQHRRGDLVRVLRRMDPVRIILVQRIDAAIPGRFRLSFSVNRSRAP